MPESRSWKKPPSLRRRPAIWTAASWRCPKPSRRSRRKASASRRSLPPEAPAILIAADEPDGVHWRVGYNNFFVITRYNHSALYAMAVYELAAAVKQRMLANDAASLAGPLAAPLRAPSAAVPSGVGSGAPPLATTATPP